MDSENLGNILGKLLWSTLVSFRAPRFVDMEDLRLGVANRSLQVLVIAYFIIAMAVSREYEVKYKPTGQTQYYFEKGSLGTRDYTDFCDEVNHGKYEYRMIWNEGEGSKYWDEFNQQCYQPSFQEVNVKVNDVGWIYTYVKDTVIVKDTCDAIPSEEYCKNNFTNSGMDGAVYHATYLDDVCSCEKYNNYFFPGVEDLGLGIDHTFKVEEMNHYETNVLTRIRKYSDGKGEKEAADYKVFQPGETISLETSELLQLAGITSLDARNEKGMALYPAGNKNEFLSYRVSGFEIQLDFQYIGSIGPTIPKGSNVELILSVRGVPGYSSKGNEVSYSPQYSTNSYPNMSEFPMYIHDRYYRGIKIVMIYGGVVGTFDFSNFIVVLTSVTILFSISTFIVSAIAFYLLGYHSEIYNNYGQTKVSIKYLNAKKAGQLLIGGKAWRESVCADPKASVGVKEIVNAYVSQGHSVSDARTLALHLLSYAGKNEDPGVEWFKKYVTDAKIHADHKESRMNLDDFLELISEDETAVKRLLEELEDIDHIAFDASRRNLNSNSALPVQSFNVNAQHSTGGNLHYNVGAGQVQQGRIVGDVD